MTEHQNVPRALEQEAPDALDAALRPCPFCMGTPRPDRILLDGCRDGQADVWAYYVRCIQCAAQGPWFETAGKARRAWNVRLTPPKSIGEVTFDKRPDGTVQVTRYVADFGYAKFPVTCTLHLSEGK